MAGEFANLDRQHRGRLVQAAVEASNHAHPEQDPEHRVQVHVARNASHRIVKHAGDADDHDEERQIGVKSRIPRHIGATELCIAKYRSSRLKGKRAKPALSRKLTPVGLWGIESRSASGYV